MSNANTSINIFQLFYLILLRFEGLLYPPAGRISEYGLNQTMPNAIPDIGLLSSMLAAGYLTPEQFNTFAARLGYDDPFVKPFRALAESRLTPDQYLSLWRRGFLSEDGLEYVLTELKYRPDEQTLLKKVSEYFPPPPDLIRFAVREVYSKATAEKFGQFEDLPEEFLRESRKAGLSEDQARNYWAAHWELPSASMGFEMFQRRIIDRDTLGMLLKSLDVMPYWRDKLIELSYKPLTRVDVRRMYGLGVLDEEGVYNSYLDTGYSPENARLMTEYTVRYENSELDGITRTNLIGAFKKSIIDENELREYLRGLGYSEKTVEFWVSNAEYENYVEDLDVFTSELSESYQAGELSAEQVRNELLKKDVPSKFVDDFMNKTVLRKAKKSKLPSVDDLVKWYNSGVVDEDYFRNRMRRVGMMDEDIDNYIKANRPAKSRKGEDDGN